jgi:NAD(P)-dependent dehydrogenase (short-subunit alcohol dehydrogenase family)
VCFLLFYGKTIRVKVTKYQNADEECNKVQATKEQANSIGNLLLKDKVAFVTGAGSGIGRATALRLAQQGAKVCLVDLKEHNSEKVKNEIIEADGEAIVADVDVSDPKRVLQAVDETINKWGRLDIVFANAGINGKVAPIEDLTAEDWDHTHSTNLKSTFLTVKYAIPRMKEKGGSIIITSSINGNRTFSNFGMSAYSASKAGQMAFAKMAALELARYRIRVNVICPGAIKTNIGQNTDKTEQVQKIKIPVNYPEGNQPLEHAPGQPEQVADLVLFLASDQSSHISGTEVYIDGTESLF